MAIVRLKFQQIFYLLQVFGTITNTWPPHPNIGKYKLFFRNLYCCVIIFIYVTVWVGMLMDIIKNRNSNVGELLKTVSHMGCLTEGILNSILCTVQRKQLQNLVVNIEEFMKISKNRERVILQKYIDRYVTFMIAVAISFSMAGVTVICAPLFMPQEFPLNVWYPFSLEPLLRKFILYVAHILATAHTVFCLDVDIMMALFFLYSAARLEMLASEIKQATDETHVISSIKKHQEIIEFTSKTQCTLQYILFKTNLTMAITVISGAFPLLYLHSFVLVPQYLSMPIGSLQRMFITAWAADDLKEVCLMDW
ncbi:uncharacterized protein [Polyergus mexicanus]|uniref:uncharacterized protein isoform X2 n=1 Tax=Polyergus mexicanus TaxID=615972 RepID=UPI0038B5C5BE